MAFILATWAPPASPASLSCFLGSEEYLADQSGRALRKRLAPSSDPGSSSPPWGPLSALRCLCSRSLARAPACELRWIWNLELRALCRSVLLSQTKQNPTGHSSSHGWASFCVSTAILVCPTINGNGDPPTSSAMPDSNSTALEPLDIRQLHHRSYPLPWERGQTRLSNNQTRKQILAGTQRTESSTAPGVIQPGHGPIDTHYAGGHASLFGVGSVCWFWLDTFCCVSIFGVLRRECQRTSRSTWH